MGVIDDLLNIVTLGGHGRLKEAQQEYEVIYARYSEMHRYATDVKNTVDYNIKVLGLSTQVAFSTLQMAHSLVVFAQRKPEARQLYHKSPCISSIAVPRTECLIESYHSVYALVKGLEIGSIATVGSWSLVSLLGTASTGTAIATLSGVAARNAMLAWFGGGALWAGGAGMAGGSLVLGGITVIPMLIFASWKSYARAKELDEEGGKLVEAIGGLEGHWTV
jgi:hypothetical protein